MNVSPEESTHSKPRPPRLPFLTDQTNPKVEILYVSVMCLVANCLSSVALEVGTRLPLGQTSVAKSGAFHSLFRRSYSLKVNVLITNIVSGVISTMLVVMGDKYGVPYLYIPWLVNTIRGMALCEGPALLGLAYMLVPDAGIPAGSFLFITLLLYVEELCLWNDVFASFQQCWMEYSYRKRRAIAKTKDKSDVESIIEQAYTGELVKAVNFFTNTKKFNESCTERSNMARNYSLTMPAVVSATSILSNLIRNAADARDHAERSRFTAVND